MEEKVSQKPSENKQKSRPGVLAVMGSDSDLPVVKPLFDVLRAFDIPYEARVCSAHRTPELAAKLSAEARDRGIGVIVAAAGMAAHLAGVMAASTTLPVIAIPIASGAFQGIDALLASVQMPPGVPVATMAVNGAKNAGILAAQILGVFDADLAARLAAEKERMATAVLAKDAKLQENL